MPNSLRSEPDRKVSARTAIPASRIAAAAVLLLYTALPEIGRPAVAAAEIRAAEGILVVYPDMVSDDRAQALADRMAEERRRVREWWGASFEEPIRVRVSDAVSVSMALVPAWRGERGSIDLPLSLVQRGSAASLHELVHVYAANGNRFLAEGLAVYAHDLLGGIAAFPNFGRNLHELAQPVAADRSIVELERYATPRPIGGRAAYLAAGSFVGFLIERHGMASFRQIYALTPLAAHARDAGDPARWQKIYGRPLAQIEREWRRFLEGGGR